MATVEFSRKCVCVSFNGKNASVALSEPE
jgi:hypothetical protein